MADTIGGGINDDGTLQNTLVIDDADAGKIDVTGLENSDSTKFAVTKPIDDLEVGLAGDTAVKLTGKKLSSAVLSNEAPKGKVAEVKVSNKKTSDLEFVTTGKGATELTFAKGSHSGFSVTTAKGKAKDEITFGGTTTVKKGEISTGKGPDVISFADGLTLKGKTVVETGNGKDVIEVGEVSGKGKLILSDFSGKDKLIAGGETLKLGDIKDGDAPSFIKLS